MPDLTKYNSISLYLIAKIRHTRIYSLIKRITGCFRPFLLIVRIFKYVLVALNFLEVGIVVVIAFAAFLVALPIILIYLITLSARDFVAGRKILGTDRLSHLLSADKIFIFSAVGRFGTEFAKSISEEGYAVIILTTDIRRNFFGGHFSSNILFASPYFFFMLKKKKLDGMSGKLIYMLGDF